MTGQFHGWANFETYCVVSSLTEDAKLQRHWINAAHRVWAAAVEEKDSVVGTITRSANARFELAGELRRDLADTLSTDVSRGHASLRNEMIARRLEVVFCERGTLTRYSVVEHQPTVVR